jgi:hypothetical protein
MVVERGEGVPPPLLFESEFKNNLFHNSNRPVQSHARFARRGHEDGAEPEAIW